MNPQQPPQPVASAASQWRVLAVLCVAVFTINVDGTIVNVALPTLVRDARRFDERTAVGHRRVPTRVLRVGARGRQPE